MESININIRTYTTNGVLVIMGLISAPGYACLQYTCSSANGNRIPQIRPFRAFLCDGKSNPSPKTSFEGSYVKLVKCVRE